LRARCLEWQFTTCTERRWSAFVSAWAAVFATGAGTLIQLVIAGSTEQQVVSSVTTGCVVAGSAAQDVSALIAFENVISCASRDMVISALANQEVVTVAAF
jgi:hypothetical protein